MSKRPSWIGIEAARKASFELALAPIVSAAFRGYLPLELCPGLNAFAEMPTWRRAKLKSEALQLLAAQCGDRPRKPLQGRPVVRLTRFSSVEPDAHSAWSKVPVDCLVASWTRGGKRHEGLGFLEDDRPSCVELVTQWVCAPRGKGFVMVEVLVTSARCARGGEGATERVNGVVR